MSNSADGFPVAVELQWPQPIVARHVRLIFDTGLHRVLTFSLADAYTAQMVWGRPQPETVRDYRVELFLGTDGRAVAAIEGNYQRLRVHPLDQKPFDRLRLTITATNGLDHARVCEIRVER
jgi:hypothetical protein